MKRVLALAYYFPPLGGAGVQRTVKFLKHLPALGYEAVVVTGAAEANVPWAPPDASLIAEIHPSTAVLRTPGPPPQARPKVERRRRLLGRPSTFEEWWRREAVVAAQPALSEIDVIYASMSPFGSAAAAAALASAAGVPWVADLRDPWALDDWAVYPSALHRLLERRRMRTALTRADAIIMNTPEARRALLAAFPEFAARRVEVIPNGWDRDDFSRPAPSRDDQAFRIVYAGYSHVQSDRPRRSFVRKLVGGAGPTVDRLTRSHLPLIEALNRLDEIEPKLAKRVEIHVAGPATSQPGRLQDDRVVQRGYLSHPEAVDLMRSADLIFLPMHHLRPGVRARTVMGKTYEYLASGRPILAGLPDGDVRDLLAPLPNVWLCGPADIPCLAEAIRAVMLAPPRGCTAPRALLARFERRALAVELVRVLEAVVAEPLPVSRRSGSRTSVSR